MIENLIFGKSGFNTSVFEEHFISYSCILFIKYYALRSFYIKLLCFSKNCVFQIFDRLNLFFNQSKMRFKFFFFNLIYSIIVGSIESGFQSIESNFRSIENRIESFFYRLFFSRVQTIFQNFQKLFSLYSIGLRFQVRFLSFLAKFLQGFLSSKAGKTFLPLLFHFVFHVSCIFFMLFRENVEPMKIWDFCWFKPFLWKLIDGFLLWDNINLIFAN